MRFCLVSKPYSPMADSCDMESAASYRCGNCNSHFSTICHLYKHFSSYDSDGSFHFDNLLKVGFPKYDSACTSTQTDISLFDTSDLDALFLLKKHWHKLSPIIHDLESICNETLTVNATDSTDKATTRKSQLRTRQTKATKAKSMALNQMKQKPHKTANVTKDQAKQTDVNSQDLLRPPQDLTTKSFGKTKQRKSMIKCKQITASSKDESDMKKAEIRNTGKLLPDICLEQGASTSEVEEICVEEIDAFGDQHRNISCKELDPEKHDVYHEQEKMYMISKTPSDCNTKEVTEPIESYKSLEKGKTSNSVSKHNIQCNNPTLSFYVQESKKQGTVKVSQTWTPTVADFVQQSTTQSDMVSQLHVAVISNVKDPLQTKPTQKQHKTLVCEVCSKRIRKYGYKDHLNTHFGRTPFVCEICGKRFTSKKALGMHKFCSHIEESRKKQCKFCDKKFPTTSGLEQHMLTHTKDKEFVCVKCGRVFYNKYALNKHVIRVHDEVTKFYQCQECDKKFKSKPHLNEHIRSHSLVFTCDICGASFNRQSSKQRHMKIHTGERDHECHICGHKFIQKTLYWVHMEKHHDLTQDQLRELFPGQHGGNKYRLPESITQLEIQTHTEDM